MRRSLTFAALLAPSIAFALLGDTDQMEHHVAFTQPAEIELVPPVPDMQLEQANVCAHGLSVLPDILALATGVGARDTDVCRAK